jgi:hypothetical protein
MRFEAKESLMSGAAGALPWMGVDVGCSFVRQMVAAAFGLAPTDLEAPTRLSARAAFARQVAMYISHVHLRLSLSEVGRYFGRDRTTAGHACRTVEDRRDDPSVDRIIDCIGRAIDGWRGAMTERPG